MKEKEEAEAKKKLERSQRMTESKARGKSMPATAHKTLGRHKTTSSLLTNTTIDKSQLRAIRKNQSSGDIMRTANQMAKNKKNNIDHTSTNKDKALVKSNTSRSLNKDYTPINSKKKYTDKTNDSINEKESDKKVSTERDQTKEKESENDQAKKSSTTSTAKKAVSRRESKSDKKRKEQTKAKTIEKKQKQSEEKSKDTTIEKKDEVPLENTVEATKKIEITETEAGATKDKQKENEKPNKESNTKEDTVIETQKENNDQYEPRNQLITINEKQDQSKPLIVNWGTLSNLLTHEEKYIFGQLNKALMNCYLFSTKSELQIELASFETSLNEIRQVSHNKLISNPINYILNRNSHLLI